MADGAEDGVGSIAGAAFEIAAAEMAVGFQVSDHGLDGGAAPQFAFNDAEDAALWPETPSRSMPRSLPTARGNRWDRVLGHLRPPTCGRKPDASSTVFDAAAGRRD